MPFIDSKVTFKLTDSQKEDIKTELGRLITTLGKSENYLMVSIEDACDLWLAGKKLERAPTWPSACMAARPPRPMTSSPARSAPCSATASASPAARST